MHTIVRCLALAGALALGACGGGSLSTDEGQLRRVNAASAVGNLDLFADNAAVVTAIAPFTGSGYASLKQDTYTLDLRQSGNAATLLTTTTTLARKKHQTVVAYSNGNTLAATVLDDEEGDPGSGKAKLRIFNTASSDPVDVYLTTAECASLDSSLAAPTTAAVAGLQSAYSELASSATAYHLCVTTAGDRSEVRLDIPSFTLSEKRIVTVILAASAGGALMNAVVLDQQGAATQALNPSARVRVAASVSPSVPVSVTVNGTQVTSALTSPNVGPYTVVAAGALTVNVNGTDIALTTPAFVAAPGADVTLLLTGSTPTVTPIADDNTTSASTTKPVKLRVVNGLNGIAGTATLTLNNVVVGSGADNGRASGYTQVASSAGLARLEARIGTVQVFFAATATLESGRVYSLFLLGDAADAPDTGILVPDR
jgi:hypothetical protein